MSLASIILAGTFVRLQPLTIEHLPGLMTVGLELSLWQWTVNKNRAEADMRRYVESALGEAAHGVSLPFATIHEPDGRVIGSTRFGNISPEHWRAEIGWTWLAQVWQRTGANAEAKLLMLGNAFEVWACQRVEFKTNVLNIRSHQPILRRGATEEGIFRRHRIAQDGSVRDTVYHGILVKARLGVRHRLRARLGHASSRLSRRPPGGYLPGST